DEQTIGIGSPGGKRIPAVMSDVLTRYLLIGDDWENAIDDSRFYIEDDKIYTEEELDTDIQAQLRQIGYEIYNISEADFYGVIQHLCMTKRLKNCSVLPIIDALDHGKFKKNKFHLEVTYEKSFFKIVTNFIFSYFFIVYDVLSS